MSMQPSPSHDPYVLCLCSILFYSAPQVDEFDGDTRPLAEKQKWTLRDQPEVVFEELRAVALLRPGTFSDLRLVVSQCRK